MTDERSSLKHPLSKQLLQLKIFSRHYFELSSRDQRIWDQVVALCQEIHKHGWNAKRRSSAQQILKAHV